MAKTGPVKGRPRSKLSAQQAAHVDAVLTGQPSPSPNPTQTSKSVTVQEEIAKARAELSDLTTLKRVDVIDGIMRGINIAEMMADAANVIRGWTEIAKILGHYAPEVKQINLNINQQRVRSKLEALSDEELLAIAEGKTVVDVEFTEVPKETSG